MKEQNSLTKEKGPWIYNVRDFGAYGNGTRKDTEAIQAAIDACTAKGGGRVLLPAGCYLSGTIYLKDNVELHLAQGAVLLGSPDRRDYNTEDRFADSIVPHHYDKISPHQKASTSHLVTAHRCRNVSITGPGTIDGNSAAFFHTEIRDLPYRYKIRPVKRGDWTWRPGEMVWFCRCRGVAVRDVKIINPPFWAAILVGCEDVQVRGITIDVPPTTWNGDGLNIDGCRNVVISDCIIRSADDSIALKNSESVFPKNRFADGTPMPDCENIVVSNCILSSPTRGILLGVGAEGRIRHCRFDNIIIRDTRTGIGIRSRYGSADHCLYGEKGSGLLISDVHFSNFTLECITPFRIEVGYPGADPLKAGISDVSFSNFTIRCGQKGELLGQPQAPLRRAHFRDMDWHVEKDERIRELLETGQMSTRYLAAPGQGSAFLISHVEDCTFEGIRLYWHNPDPEMLDGFDISHSRDIEVKDVTLRQPRSKGGSALRFQSSSKIRVTGCRAAKGTTTFLTVQDSPPGSTVHCLQNDFSSARTALESDVPVREEGNAYGPGPGEGDGEELE